MAPSLRLSVIKIVKYCGVCEGGGALGGAKILQKIMTPIKINKYCGVGGVCWGGGGFEEALKFYKR